MRAGIMALATTTSVLFACFGLYECAQETVWHIVDDLKTYPEEARSLSAAGGTIETCGTIDAQRRDRESGSSDALGGALREALIGSSGILMLIVGFWYLLKKWGEVRRKHELWQPHRSRSLPYF